MHTAIQLHALLLQGGAMLPDTIYTKPVSTGFFQAVSTIAGALMTLAVLLLAVTGFLLAWYFRGIYKGISHLIGQVEREVVPLMHTVAGLTGDVRTMVDSVKGDVKEVQETVSMANGRARDVVRRTEARIKRFESLLDVVEDEAEEVVVSAAAAVRGVRTGLQGLLDQFMGYGEMEEDEDDGYAEGAADARRARPRTARPRSQQWDGDDDELL